MKWGPVRSFLEDAGLLQSDRIVEPLEASEEDLLVVCNRQLSCYPLVLQLVICALCCTMQCEFMVCGLPNQVHSESYLNSLKSSEKVARIVEVLLHSESRI